MQTENNAVQVEDIQSRLESTLADYQEQHRYERLRGIGTTMEETLLQKELANALFEEQVTIDSEAIEEVTQIQRIVRDDELRRLDESSIEELEEKVQSEERRISSQIKERCINRLETVQAFSKLNQELEFMDQSRLNALEDLLQDWNRDRGSLEVSEAESLEERIADAREMG
jgi:SHS2 domain-containing protein